MAAAAADEETPGEFLKAWVLKDRVDHEAYTALYVKHPLGQLVTESATERVLRRVRFIVSEYFPDWLYRTTVRGFVVFSHQTRIPRDEQKAMFKEIDRVFQLRRHEFKLDRVPEYGQLWSAINPQSRLESLLLEKLPEESMQLCSTDYSCTRTKAAVPKKRGAAEADAEPKRRRKAAAK